MINPQFIIEKPGQHVMEVKFRAPRFIPSEEGVMTRIITGNPIRDVYKALQDAKLPADKGPYADKDGALAKMAWQMRKAGKGDLESEIKWLVEILMPRFILDDEGIQPNILPDIRSYANEFLVNSCSFAHRDHERIMSAGEILTEPEIEFQGDKYLQILFQEELSLVAAGVLLKANREASVSILIRPDGGQCGVVVFPKEDMMVTFAIDITHPPLKGVAFLDDNARMSIIALQAAENSWRRSITKMHLMGSERDIDISVRSAIKKALLAQKYSSENLQAAEFIAMVEASGRRQKKQMLAERIGEDINNLFNEIIRQGGIGKKRFLRSPTLGVPEEEVEQRVRKLIDRFASAIEVHGAIEDENDPFYHIRAALAGFVREVLPQNGLPENTLKRIIQYEGQKLSKIQ